MTTTYQVSLDDCYCGGSKRYYLDTSAPEEPMAYVGLPFASGRMSVWLGL